MSRTRPSLTALGLAVALGLGLACTLGRDAGTRSPSDEIRVVNNVVVSFTDPVRELPFDTNAARLAAASEQLAALAGHRVEYRFDRALLPQYREEFEAMLITSIENTAIDLDRLRDRDSFPELVALLHRIELTYDVAAHEGIGWTSELDVLLDAPPFKELRGYLPPVDAIDAVIDLMCKESRRADLDAVRRGVQARVRRRPEDRKALARLELHSGC